MVVLGSKYHKRDLVPDHNFLQKTTAFLFLHLFYTEAFKTSKKKHIRIFNLCVLPSQGVSKGKNIHFWIRPIIFPYKGKYHPKLSLTCEEEAESVLSRSRRPNFGLFNQSIIDISVFLNFCLCFNSQEILCVLIVSDAQWTRFILYPIKLLEVGINKRKQEKLRKKKENTLSTKKTTKKTIKKQRKFFLLFLDAFLVESVFSLIFGSDMMVWGWFW